MFAIAAIHTLGVAHWGAWHGWFWPVIPILWLGLIGFVVVMATRYWLASHGGWDRSAKSILAERYARGEIDLEEYRRRKDGLS